MFQHLFFFYVVQRGIRSPRAYVHYDSLQDLNPKYVEQILTNSLSDRANPTVLRRFPRAVQR